MLISQTLLRLSVVFGPALAQYAIKPSYGDTFQVHSQYNPTGAFSICGPSQEFQYSFANSYGTPAAVTIEPPSCGTSFTAVSFTLQNVADGTQYDRLMILSLGNGEVWRSSTFEPVSSGTYSTYTKDMTFFSALLKVPQTGTLEINNVIDASTGIIGVYNVTLTATYYYGTAAMTKSPDHNFALSTQGGSSDAASYFKLANGAWGNTSISNIPRNSAKATVTIMASGGTFGDGNTDEFWWSSASPFREVQLYIDDVFAGAYWPFPVVYTGGVDPSFWRPIVGIHAYDAFSQSIDVTPFLGTLSDNGIHQFSLRVAAGRDGWFVSGHLNIWRKSDGSVTTGTSFASNAESSAIITNSGMSATRSYQISAIINGMPYTVSQDLDFSNVQTGTSINQITNGTDTVNGISNVYSWPISYSAVTDNGSTQATLSHAFHLSSLGINTVQTAKTVSSGSIGYSSNTQIYTDRTGYSRTVSAKNGAVSTDSNPAAKHRRKRHPSVIKLLDNLISGPLPSFFEVAMEVSVDNLKALVASIEALDGFDVTKVPKQVVFAPPTALTQGERFYLGS